MSSESWVRLKETLEKLGIEPKKSLGQNFLISDLVIKKIISAAQDCHPTSLIEIGPGPGALTYFLKDFKSQLELIELDRAIAQYWRDQNINVIEADALQMDWNKILEKSRPLVLVSNLPYQISSSLVIDRSLDSQPLNHMVLMFQKEVAQRIQANHRQSEYGMLSVVAQSFWKIKKVCEASPRDFSPPPKVASRVLAFEALESPVSDKKKYFRFIKSAFLQPRKLMASNLEQGGVISKEQALILLKDMGLSEKARPAELNIKQYVDFYHRLGYKDPLHGN